MSSWRHRPAVLSLRVCILLCGLLAPLPRLSPAAQTRLPAGGGIVELEARQLRREGNLYIAEGDVEIRYLHLRLRADRVEYDQASSEAVAQGNVILNVGTQEISAEEARYNIRTGRGRFLRAKGSFHVRRAPQPSVLLTQNPLSFSAREVERVDDRTYVVRDAWVTVCEPDKPVWRFHAQSATVRIEGQARLVNATFHLLDVPVLYLPVATGPAGRRSRQSGFLVPTAANSSSKGVVIGTAYYWAPAEWMDLTVGAEHLSRRGFSHQAELRSLPWNNIRFDASYYAVNDRGLPGSGGVRVPQGGYKSNLSFEGLLPDGWRAVLDANKLTSLTFRLAFAETFAEAVDSESRSTFFLANHFRGFSLSFSARNYKNFLSAAPETAVVLRQAPGVYFSSRDRALWSRWPVYFGFHVMAGALHRNDPGLRTPDAVQRFEAAPRVTIPLRWGPWLSLTPAFQFRATRYGGQLSTSGGFLSQPLVRATGEIEVDVRPPSLARIWETGGARWKHVVEPQLVYRYVRGVDRFHRFLRFDENDTLTDTSELEYSITSRFFRRGHAATEEIVSWRVTQKHYFDPTFNGALVPGRRNVFQALSSITAFAFADGRRSFSPVVSDLRFTPGGRYDAQFRVDIDPERRQVVAWGTLVKMKPYRDSFVTLAHFATRANPALQPRSNQIRALVGFGETNRRGWNAVTGFSYDIRQRFLQNQTAQVSYNGGCCGIAFEYRRLALGQVRRENQFRVALLIANIGTFGSLRRQEKIFE